jgi:hypothetical protein
MTGAEMTGAEMTGLSVCWAPLHKGTGAGAPSYSTVEADSCRTSDTGNWTDPRSGSARGTGPASCGSASNCGCAPCGSAYGRGFMWGISSWWPWKRCLRVRWPADDRNQSGRSRNGACRYLEEVSPRPTDRTGPLSDGTASGHSGFSWASEGRQYGEGATRRQLLALWCYKAR